MAYYSSDGEPWSPGPCCPVSLCGLESGVGWDVDRDGAVKVPLVYTEVKYERSKQEGK